ncbi:MAG TPA: DUF3141 domain-containing protein, partial [Polyangiaceae bacterium]|nr:DUF3141 domain-containing protein [Polyangiaceae bacterium]
RVEHWAISDLNPFCWWLGPAARAVQADRTPAAADNPLRKVESAASELVSGSLDFYRNFRDALTEACFFSIYGHLFFRLAEEDARAAVPGLSARDPRSMPLLAAALGGMESGGYAAALARTAELLQRSGAPVPLARIERKAHLMKEYAELLPDISEREWKLTRGQQDTIVRFEPERALSTLPHLLADPTDRERFLNVLEHVANDREFTGEPTREQREMLDRIRELVRTRENTVRRPAA